MTISIKSHYLSCETSSIPAGPLQQVSVRGGWPARCLQLESPYISDANQIKGCNPNKGTKLEKSYPPQRVSVNPGGSRHDINYLLVAEGFSSDL
ncbi:hypothetical protein RRG08_005759 [Elysia crispata]|uniref:Uncharacterized protein n=1 Tax=Elysia crispata TaxID=231223 RepID=A0AAE0YDK0_9GAST|nr:hypothetical protein RRG08_005759 [Elysia crispata]